MEAKKIAIFASGRGSNAAQIIKFYKERSDIQIVLIVASKASAKVLDLATENDIPSIILDKQTFTTSSSFLKELKDRDIDLIILAGFLWLLPSYLIDAYANRVINIHPALLPKYGGKGMYGHHVHEAVHTNKEKESGITIHLVNEQFDEGAHLFQASCSLNPNDNPSQIAAKVLTLEHAYFAQIIDLYLRSVEKKEWN